MKTNIFKRKEYANAGSVSHNVEGNDHEDINSSHIKPNVPEGIMVKCRACGKIIYIKTLERNYKICDSCGAYFSMLAYERMEMILDNGEFEEYDKQIGAKDPLDFPGYRDKMIHLQTKTGLVDGIVTGKGKINGIETMLGVMDGSFMMGSMGTAIGEKLTRLFERATEENLPVIVFTASGGARMQEGILSLMQMAKVSGAIGRHSAKGLLYITVLTNPTTGGVTASFAMEGDIILAEPNALIGFAGPRVIEQTIGQKLPDGFQRSEFLLNHGFVDAIVSRENMRAVLSNLLRLHSSGV